MHPSPVRPAHFPLNLPPLSSAHSWTTQSLRVVSHTEIPFDGRPTGFDGFKSTLSLTGGSSRVKRSGGSCCMTLIPTSRNTCATDPEHCQWRIGFWDTYSVVSEKGQRVVYVMFSEGRDFLARARQGYVCIHLSSAVTFYP
jgi:hypothetical protein